MAVSKREARRERNREDFLRATTAAIRQADPKHASVYRGQIGINAGNTYREHLEDEIRKAVRVHKKLVDECQRMADNFETGNSWGEQGVEHKRKAARGVIRGLCKALLIYEDSYNKDDKLKLVRMEKEFLNEGNENG